MASSAARAVAAIAVRQTPATSLVVACAMTCACVAPDASGNLAASVEAPPSEVVAKPEPRPNVLDLLFVLDNSCSMSEEVNNLAGNAVELFRPLITGDLDGDGVADVAPYRDIHVGLVTSDMGTAGLPVPTCSDDGDPDGDDAILQTAGNTFVTGCEPTHPAFQSLTSPADLDAFVARIGCVLRPGLAGCGFEQQLEAALKAVTPSTSELVFVSGAGHADRENAGFLRPGAVLGVVLFTDEEDCSAADADIFDTQSSRFPGEALNLRCHRYGDPSFGAVQPVSRYVDGLLAAVDGDPRRLVYAAIAGIPPDAPTVSSSESARDVLAHPNMREEIDSMDPNRLRTSCNVPGLGISFPPRRMVSVAGELAARGAEASAHTICEADLRPALRSIARDLL